MGLIRKSLAVGSMGIVRPNSKKQRVAKAQLKELRKQTAIMESEAKAEARTTSSDDKIADAVARASAESRARSAAARAVAAGGTHEERKAKNDAIRAAANAAPSAMPVAVALPVEGWYLDPDRDHLLRWWDGADWTDRTAPRPN